MSLQMSRPGREAFLAEVHVGVISIAEPARGPFSVPIWYAYTGGAESRGGSIRVSLRPERWLSVDYARGS